MDWTDKDEAALAAMIAKRAEWRGVVMPALCDAIMSTPGEIIQFQKSYVDTAEYFVQQKVADRWMMALLPFSSFAGLMQPNTDAPTAPGK